LAFTSILSFLGKGLVHATVTSSVNQAAYVGNGSVSVYSYPFRIFQPTDMLVNTLTASTTQALTLNSDFTLGGAGLYNGGSITLLAGPLATGVTIILQRNVPYTQLTSFRNQGSYLPANHENAFDKLTMLSQQLQGLFNSSLVPFVSAGGDLSGSYPNPTVAQVQGKNIHTWSPISVKEAPYNAYGDGVHDDTAAFRSAIAAVEALTNGGTLFVPQGQYMISGPITLTKQIHISGEGNGPYGSPAWDLKNVSYSPAALFIDGSGAYGYDIEITNFSINASSVSVANLPYVVDINEGADVYFRDFNITGAPATAVWVYDSQKIIFEACQNLGTGQLQNPTCGAAVTADVNFGVDNDTVFSDCRTEDYNIGIAQFGYANVFLSNNFMLGNKTGWLAQGNSTGSLTSVGGVFQGSTTVQNAALVQGPNVNVFGGQYTNTAVTCCGLTVVPTFTPKNCYVYGASGQVYDTGGYSNNQFQNNSQSPVSVAGSAGWLKWIMPQQGASDKRFVLQVSGFTPSAAVTITYPQPFTVTPPVVANTSGVTATVSTTTIIYPNAGTTQTGYIILDGL
jgi:hypothetical protein